MLSPVEYFFASTLRHGQCTGVDHHTSILHQSSTFFLSNELNLIYLRTSRQLIPSHQYDSQKNELSKELGNITKFRFRMVGKIGETLR
jgi:hypothetical protein